MTGTARTLAKLTAHHRRLLPVTGAIIVFVSMLGVVTPLYTKAVLEYVIPRRASHLLAVSFLLFLAFLAIRFVFTALQDLAVVVLRQKLERHWLERYLDALLRLRLRELASRPAGDLVSRFSVFINDVEWFLCDFLFFVFYALFIFCFLSAVLAAIDWPLFLLVAAFLPLHALNLGWFGARMRPAAEREQARRGALASFVLQSIEARGDVRSYHLHAHFAAEHGRAVAEVSEARFARKRLGILQQGWQAGLTTAGHLAVVALAAHQMATGRTTAGTLLLFLLLLDSFHAPIYRLPAVNEALQAACVKIERVAELVECPEVEAPLPAALDSAPASMPASGPAASAPDAAQRLTLRGLCCGALFSGLDRDFARGNIYFVTGPSGCGKSTLLQMMSRLHSPALAPFAGRMLIDGEDTSGWPEHRVRSLVQCCSQDSLLFNRSVALNVHLGDPEALDRERVRRAAWLAAADRFIEALPNQYDHELLEDGGNLSGGERQRVNLARLFYYDAPVMLLDEPTSALDAATEQLVFERLRAIKRDKIIIAVSHREQSHRHADVILRLTPGGLVELPHPGAH